QQAEPACPGQPGTTSPAPNAGRFGPARNMCSSTRLLSRDRVKGVVHPMKPNIVIIQADQMAPQALGAYGDTAAQTPHIDGLAADGAVFDRAYCNPPLCAPSRASMMTGRMPAELGCFDN